MLVIKYRKIFFIISAITTGASLVIVLIWGLMFGIDFTGGSLTEVSYTETVPAKSEIEGRLNGISTLGNYSLRPSGENNYILRTQDLTEEERIGVMSALSFNESTPMNVERFNTIGPVIGEELRNKAFIAIVIVVLAIISFIAFAFRKVSEPVSSWKYGMMAIVALLHDILIPVGMFAVLGHFFGAEVDILFVMALLAILGYSVNDTIVVFDRVRENLKHNEETNSKEDFELTVGKSLNQTYARSINTSITTASVLVMLFVIGGDVTQYFALTLFAGVLAGTYSSIFLATPLLVAMNDFQNKKK